MTIIVETGTGSADSEAYASVAYCDNYHSNIGNVAWAALSDASKEQALRRATMFMCQYFRLQWKGYRVNAIQALDWPRHDVQVPDLGVFNVIYPDTVPALVQQANAELALLASTSELNPSKTQNVLSVQVGPIKKVYDTASPQGTRYSAVEDLLAPLLKMNSGGNIKLRRT